MNLKSHIKQGFTILLCGALSFTAKASNDAIKTFLATPEFKHASISLQIKDLNSGKILASHNPQQSLTPASILKVVTTASAIELLGVDYQFKTTLSFDKNNPDKLIVKGHGDPTLGSEHIVGNKNLFLATWTNQIKKQNKTSPINILVADDYFGYDGQSRKWIKEDMGNYYAAGAFGISIYDNTYRLNFNTTGAKATIISTNPKMKDIEFENTLSLNSNNKDNGYILGEPLSNKRRIIGDIPKGKASFSIKGDIPDPGLFLAETLANHFLKNGIKINNYTTSRLSKTNYTEGTVFYTHKSPTLSSIIKVINNKSNNHYSEHLIRAIGQINDTQANPLSTGVEQVQKLWKSKGLDTDGLFMYDGCGLAPSNAINSGLMVDILDQMKDNQAFTNSLPKAGVEGTVRYFLKGTKLEGKVIVKSGSIGKVQCFAGYYINGSEKYAFTVMVNNFNGSHRNTVKAIENLLVNIF